MEKIYTTEINKNNHYEKETFSVFYNGKEIGYAFEDRYHYNTQNISYMAYVFKTDYNRFEYLGRDFKTYYAAKLAIIKYFEECVLTEASDFFIEKKSKFDVSLLTQGDSSEFYPTPNSLVGKMLRGIDWHGIETVLEPEAGKGDLVKGALKAYENNQRYSKELDIDCIEKDIYLQHILRGEGFRVIHDDFLTYNGKKKYDLILMNPPFSNADEHLLKALEVQKNGGSIVCIMNAETLRNPYTMRRQYLVDRLNEVNAKIEYLKHEFKKAERQSNVEIALVKVFIPYEEGESEFFSRLKKDSKNYEEEKQTCKELAPKDLIEQIVRYYDMEVEASLNLIREYNAMKPYILDSFDKNSTYKRAILTLTVGTDSNHLQELNVNQYLKAVRTKYWNELFSRREFTGKLTSNLQEKYMNMVKSLADYDFTLYNIERIYAEMNTEMIQGIKTSILNLFDRLSEKHSWYPECEKNIHYYSGWKTNKAHKVGKKVILPVNGMFSSYSRYDGPLDTYRVFQELSDIEKVFNYLTGNMNAECWLHNTIEAANKRGQTKNIECKYFTVTLYKKGTVHITFKDKDLVDTFNIFAARNKNWLPPCYGKKDYSEMTQEEKTVVVDFQGEEDYKKVMQNKEKFLYSIPEQLLLTEEV